MSSNNENIISSVNEKEVKQILDKQKFYNILNILLSLLSHVINITSVLLSFASTHNHCYELFTNNESTDFKQ